MNLNKEAVKRKGQTWDYQLREQVWDYTSMKKDFGDHLKCRHSPHGKAKGTWERKVSMDSRQRVARLGGKIWNAFCRYLYAIRHAAYARCRWKMKKYLRSEDGSRQRGNEEYKHPNWQETLMFLTRPRSMMFHEPQARRNHQRISCEQK